MLAQIITSSQTLLAHIYYILVLRACEVNPESRVECGWAGITKEQCKAKTGCCFNNKTPGMKWCYVSRSRFQGKRKHFITFYIP